MRATGKGQLTGRNLWVAAAATTVLVGGLTAGCGGDDEQGGGPYGGQQDQKQQKQQKQQKKQPDGGYGRPGGQETAEGQAAQAAKMNAQRGISAALAKVPGTATSVEFEAEDSGDVWDVEVFGANGAYHEVTVDAQTGKVRGQVEGGDDDSDDQAEGKAAKGAKVDAEQAAAAALQKTPGTLTSMEFVEARGGGLWDIEIYGKNGENREVTVDAMSGQVGKPMGGKGNGTGVDPDDDSGGKKGD